MMNKKGFTLIELLVTIMLVAVLATYSIFAYLDSIYEAENKQARTKLEIIAGGFDRFMMEHPDVSIQRGVIDNSGNDADCSSRDFTFKRLVACNYIPRLDYVAQKYQYHINGNGSDCGGSPVYMTARPNQKTGKYKGSYCAGINTRGESYDHF